MTDERSEVEALAAKPSAQDWLAAFAEALGQRPPTEEELDDLLALASAAAHGSERLAAPLACWMVGAAGTGPAEALAIARGLTLGGEPGQ